VFVFILELFMGKDLFILTRETLFTPRLILSFLAHASLTHLAFNLLWLLFFGILLERDVPPLVFISFILASGILVNLTLPFTPYSAVIGASGIIYALGAAIAIRHPFKPILALGIPVPGFLALILWTIQQIILEGTDQTAYALHLAGLVLGLLIGRFLPSRASSMEPSPGPQDIPPTPSSPSDSELEALLDAYEDMYLTQK